MAAARKAAELGKKTLVIENAGWGGTCANRGCIPTKALLTCSKRWADLKKLKRLGINIPEAGLDFPAMKKHQQQAVKIAALGAHKTLADAQAETKFGTGEIISPREVQYKDAEGNARTLTTRNIIIASGAKPQLLPQIQLSERIVTSDGLLDMEKLPESIVIVGASVIGVEFATFFAEMGVKATLIELLDRILPYEDQEAAGLLRQELTRLGVSIHTATKLETLQDTGGGILATAQSVGGQLEITADCALMCTGRQPVLNEDELNRMKIEHTKAGIKIDKNMMTSIAGIYAVGDVTGGLMLAHRAALQGEVAASVICGDETINYNENFIPAVVYSHPQIARVGDIQESASVQARKSEYTANMIARMELITSGFVKAFFREGKIIGATIAGENAAELIAPLALAVSREMTQSQLRQWVFAHPTQSEIFVGLFND